MTEHELAAEIDNPVTDGWVSPNGNFHGAPIACVLDSLAIAAAGLNEPADAGCNDWARAWPTSGPGSIKRCTLSRIAVLTAAVVATLRESLVSSNGEDAVEDCAAGVHRLAAVLEELSCR